MGLQVCVGLTCLSAALTAIAPPSRSYLAGRTTFDFSGLQGVRSGLAISDSPDLSFLVKLMLSTLVVGVLISLSIRRHDVEIAGSLLALWACSSVAGCGVAVAESVGMVNLSGMVNRPTNADRSSGLSFFPNVLGMYAAVAVPVVLSWITRGRGRAGTAVLSASFLVLGLLLADSRIALVVGLALGVIVTFRLLIQLGKLRQGAAIALVCTPVILEIGSQLVGETRLGTVLSNSSRSDAGRALIRHQNWQDFMESPLHGIGVGLAGGGVMVVLGLLAGGGILAGLGYVVHVGVTVRALWMSWEEGGVKWVAGMSAVGIIGIQLFQNSLIDRGMYVPVLIVGALLARRSLGTGANREHASPAAAERSGSD